jgi:A/G-specific adenine glycosylase
MKTPCLPPSFPHAAALRKKLAVWFAANGRDLPWRETTDPYAIAVSEMMLQQTTVAAVIPYFRRWMAKFPGVRELAAAPLEDVLSCWQGLGYYSRARNLHAAARVICEKFSGRFPSEASVLLTLPGFGPYSAGAVAAFAFDVPGVVIDANIARVLARLANMRDPIDQATGRKRLEVIAKSLLPSGQGGRAHTGALMELGALICKSGEPDCARCPVRTHCLAGEPATLPVKAPRKPTERIEEFRAIFVHGRRIGLIPSAGPRWKGLWLLPPGSPDAPVLHLEKYPITRYLVKMTVVQGGAQTPDLKFFPWHKLPPMPSPHARAVAAVLAKQYDETLEN